MISLQIVDTKNFMKHLLLTDTFDSFLTVEATITTFSTFHIDGTLHKDYYDDDELEQLNLTTNHYSHWSQLKPFFLSIIKGQHTPQNFKIVFLLSPEKIARLIVDTNTSLTASDISGLYLNLTFNGEQLTCITGSSLNIFTMDKSFEQHWDDTLKNFLKENALLFE